jgi:hypothetical protein
LTCGISSARDMGAASFNISLLDRTIFTEWLYGNCVKQLQLSTAIIIFASRAYRYAIYALKGYARAAIAANLFYYYELAIYVCGFK